MIRPPYFPGAPGCLLPWINGREEGSVTEERMRKIMKKDGEGHGEEDEGGRLLTQLS